MNPKFEEWLDEFQGFRQRHERIEEVLNHGRRQLMQWLEAAYTSGYEDAQREFQKDE